VGLEGTKAVQEEDVGLLWRELEVEARRIERSLKTLLMVQNNRNWHVGNS
jgi:hypothetical protein